MVTEKRNGQALCAVTADVQNAPTEDGREMTILLTPSCSLCSGSGWAFVEGKGVCPCNCHLQERKAKLLEDARIPKLYQKATLLRTHCASIDEVWRYARICRVANVMRPYMEPWPDWKPPAQVSVRLDPQPLVHPGVGQGLNFSVAPAPLDHENAATTRVYVQRITVKVHNRSSKSPAV